ncbi:Lachesin [Operophtera brumata]|uniref:Lachesin n=1 Tax=Operophtera brumata TaxID=104452 RepID=A0A0L7LTS0_OPEBR|nr:Lachesin [Operophtera brumata]
MYNSDRVRAIQAENGASSCLELIRSVGVCIVSVVEEPEFTDVIQNVTVPAGRSVRLACSVKNLGSYKVLRVCYAVTVRYVETHIDYIYSICNLSGIVIVQCSLSTVGKASGVTGRPISRKVTPRSANYRDRRGAGSFGSILTPR